MGMTVVVRLIYTSRRRGCGLRLKCTAIRSAKYIMVCYEADMQWRVTQAPVQPVAAMVLSPPIARSSASIRI